MKENKYTVECEKILKKKFTYDYLIQTKQYKSEPTAM